MGTKKLGVVATSVVLFGLAGTAQSPPVQVSEAPVSYESFMLLGAQVRRERFGAMSPEDKSLIMGTHARIWLESNRARLSTSQVALVQDAIEFLSPELYRNPTDPRFDKRAREIEKRFRCALPRSDVLELFGAVRSPVPRASWLDDIWVWLEDCVIG
jgi:hypothetical protein